MAGGAQAQSSRDVEQEEDGHGGQGCRGIFTAGGDDQDRSQSDHGKGIHQHGHPV